MSWETYIVGNLRFNKRVNGETQLKVLEEFSDVVEAKTTWCNRWREWKINDLSWHSHVNDEKIQGFYDKHKGKFAEFAISLYYLGEPDFDIYAVVGRRG